jgi:hypothetical protein
MQEEDIFTVVPSEERHPAAYESPECAETSTGEQEEDIFTVVPSEDRHSEGEVTSAQQECQYRKDARGYLMDDPRFISSLIFVALFLWCWLFLFVEVLLTRMLLDCSSVRSG